MKRIFLLAAVAALATMTPADAGPLRSLVGKVRQRVAERPVVRQLADDVKAIVQAPARVVKAAPVRSFVTSRTATQAIGGCPGEVCPTR